MIISPALGKFTAGAKVSIRKPSDNTLLGSADTTTAGTATVSVGNHSGPVLIEVTGAAGVFYYDEGTGAQVLFGALEKLSAIAPAVQGTIGVTTATNAAVEMIKASSGSTNVTAAQINTANFKVAQALGISDVLQAPKLIDESNATNNTLGVSTPEDMYALKLAAFAQMAKTSGTQNALELAKSIATDLADGVLDGNEGTAPIAGSIYSGGDFAAKLEAAVAEVATELVDAKVTSELLVAATGTIKTDVTAITSAGTDTDLAKAKAMFAELRTTLKSFSNGSSTGFLDTQAKRAGDDLNAAVAPELGKVGERVDTLNRAMGFFTDARAVTPTNNNGFYTGLPMLASLTSAGPAATALVRQYGSLSAVWYGFGSFDKCWTDSLTGVTSKVSCLHASAGSADYANNKIKFVLFELTGTTGNSFSYTTTRVNHGVTFESFSQFDTFFSNVVPVSGTLSTPDMAQGTGTASLNLVNQELTNLEIHGTLTSSAATCVSPATLATCPLDQIDISAARTSPAANTYRYALSGSVSTLSDQGVSLSLDSGSSVDMDLSTVDTTGSKLVAVTLLGTVKTAKTKFAGTVTVGSFQTDVNSQNRIPTKAAFTGAISDTSTGGAGEFLTGKLEASIADYNLYNGSLPDTSTNFIKGTVTFTGTVQAPSRPLLKLVLLAAATGPESGKTTLNYSYGTAVSISGTGTFGTGANSMDLSNQDAILMHVGSTGTTVKKGDKSLATITGSTINYADGFSESLM